MTDLSPLEYSILSINEERAANKANIEANMGDITRADIKTVNGYKYADVKEALNQDWLRLGLWCPTKAELGIWLSQIRHWKYAADRNVHLLVFEDDAITNVDTVLLLNWLAEDLPDDYDYMSVWVPDNQRNHYETLMTYDEDGIVTWGNIVNDENSQFRVTDRIAKAYQGYGCVATLYSPQGAANLLQVLEERGIYTPVDCFLSIETTRKGGRIKGYAPHPEHANALVAYDWNVPTTRNGDSFGEFINDLRENYIDQEGLQ